MKIDGDIFNDSLVRAVAEAMRRYGMVSQGDRVLVGFSGGSDSTALLICLYCLSARWSLRLGAAHLNHGLRGAVSDSEARHAAAVAKTLAIPFITTSCSVRTFRRKHGMGLEEAGRVLRHRFLQRAATEGGYDRIALGHHRDDDAEAVLMRLLRGSGPLGLAGIPPRGRGLGGDIPVVRPLIHTPRSAIRAFLERFDIAAVEDESNTDVRFLRNRVRHELLPLLKDRYNPSLAEGLSRMTQLMRDEEEWLTAVAAAALDELTTVDHGTFLALDRKGLADHHPALQRRVLRAAVSRCKGGLRRVGFAPIEAARRFAAAGPASGSLDLPDGLVIRGRGDRLEVQQLPRRRGRPDRSRRVVSDFEYRVDAPGRLAIREAGVELVFSMPVGLPEGGVYRTGQQTAFFDMDLLRFPLAVRNFRAGDRLAPLGMTGTQKVKKIFGDRKIARGERSRYPLLLSGPDIIWVAGLRQGRIGRIGPETRRCMKVDLVGCLPGLDGYH